MDPQQQREHARWPFLIANATLTMLFGVAAGVILAARLEWTNAGILMALWNGVVVMPILMVALLSGRHRAKVGTWRFSGLNFGLPMLFGVALHEDWQNVVLATGSFDVVAAAIALNAVVLIGQIRGGSSHEKVSPTTQRVGAIVLAVLTLTPAWWMERHWLVALLGDWGGAFGGIPVADLPWVLLRYGSLLADVFYLYPVMKALSIYETSSPAGVSLPNRS